MRPRVSLVPALFLALIIAQPIVTALQSSGKRIITLSVLPQNASAASRITAVEDGNATVMVPDVGQFVFSPGFRKGDDKVVVVTIVDAKTKPQTELGRVYAPVAGTAVQSKTKPSFEIKVISVTK